MPSTTPHRPAPRSRRWRPVTCVALAAMLGWLGGPAPLRASAGAYTAVATWPEGRPGLPADAWPAASGVAVDRAGRIYVADATTARISVIEPGGAVRLLHPPGADPGLVTPRDLAVDDGRQRVYAADPGAQAVVVFGMDGARLAEWDAAAGLAGIGVAPDGTVYTGSASTGEVHRFTPDGAPLGAWRAVRADGITADLIGGLDVSADGTLAVLDGRAPRLLLFDRRGQRTDTILLPGAVNDVVVDDNVGIVTRRWLWFTTDTGLLFHDPVRQQWNAGTVGRLTALAVNPRSGLVVVQPGGGGAASKVHRYPYGVTALAGPPTASWGGPIAPAGVLDGPDTLQVGADGHVYVLDRAPRAQWFTPAGQSRGQVSTGASAAVDAGPDGTVFTTDGVRVFARTAAGTLRWQAAVGPDATTSVAALVFDRATAQIVALDAGGGALHRFSAAGARLGNTALPAVPGRPSVWTDLATGAAGTAYVLDRYASEVVRVGPGGMARFTAASGARRVATRDDGVVLVLGRDGWVRGYDGGGARVLAFDARRPDLTPRSAPADLAVDAGGDVFVADRDADVVTRYRWDSVAAGADPPENQARCESAGDKTAAPGTIDLGATVEVTLGVGGTCTAQVATVPLDILLIIDRSGSMLGERIQLAREAAADFVSNADLAVSRIGIVSFNDGATLDAPLTPDEALLRRALAGLVARGGTRIDQGLAVANAELSRNGRPGAAPVLILLSDGGSDPAPALREAARAKQAGAEVFTINVQGDVGLLTAIASGPDHHHPVQSARALGAIFERIGDQISASALFRRLDITDRLPANMRFVAGSDVPAAAFDPAAGTLRWTLDGVPLGGVRLRYRLEPLAAGEWPTNVEAWADYVDGYGRAGRLDFPVPRVQVIGPPATPTATPTPPASATATATATPTRTPRPSATPTRRTRPRGPVYLPLAVRERCVPGERRTDVMLVIDTSNSMAGEGLAAARAAAAQFLGLLNLPADQAGVVAFNTQAALISRLTGNRAALDVALAGLSQTQPGTRIDRGLDRARLELLGPRARPASQPVIVLLTDGEQVESPEAAGRAARAVRQARVRMYAVGLGAQVDPTALAALTGEPAQVYIAPSPAELAAIYAQVAGEIPCPRAAFWGGR